jgi:gamma-glutamyltranspeptidase/glutathione hydrolase
MWLKDEAHEFRLDGLQEKSANSWRYWLDTHRPAIYSGSISGEIVTSLIVANLVPESRAISPLNSFPRVRLESHRKSQTIMPYLVRRRFLTILIGLLIAIKPVLKADEKQASWHSEGKHGAVAAGGRASVEAGMTILKSGGNAVDAAAATLLGLGVTDSKSYCLGGEIPIIIYDAKRNVVEVLVGQGVAPRLATREFFLNQPDGIPATGLLSATVPAAIDVIITALERHGSMRFSEVAEPTIKLLDSPTEPWHKDLQKTLKAMCEAEQKHKARLIGLRAVSDYFYRGPVARAIDQFSRENGGLLRYEDLAKHHTKIEQPVVANYRGYKIVKCGIWTQGPALLEALQLLDGFQMDKFKPASADAIHLQAEALKLGFADRDDYFADPDFVQVPDLKDLLDPEYANARRSLIQMDKASTERIPGDPKSKKARRGIPPLSAGIGGPALDTTTCVTADSQGNMVASTPSGWSGVVAGETGIWLGTRLQSFTLDQNSPNVLTPGKLPRITLTPTMVLKNGKAVGVISVAGGDGQEQAGMQMVTNLIDFKLAPKDAVKLGRFHTDHLVGSFRQTPPKLGSLTLDETISTEVAKELVNRGHVVNRQNGALSHPIVIWRNSETGLFQAAGDPRARRNAMAY